jgi:hypothetical protein
MKKVMFVMVLLFAMLLNGCSETQVENTTVEVTTVEEEKTVNVVLVYDDYNSTEVTVDILLSQVGSSDIAAMAYDEAQAFFNAHGFKVEYLNHSDIYDHGNMTPGDSVDMEEFLEMDLENMTFYMKVYYQEFKVNYYDEEDNLIHSETYMYSDNIEDIFDYSHFEGDYRYTDWTLEDDATYNIMPGHDIDLIGRKISIYDYEVVFRNHLDEIIKTVFVSDEEDILNNAPSPEALDGKVFIQWERVHFNISPIYYREYKPIYKKLGSIVDVLSLEYDKFTDFYDFGDSFIVKDSMKDQAQLFNKDMSGDYRHLNLPEPVGDLFLDSTILIGDTAILHGYDLTTNNGSLVYNSYLLFYNLIDEAFYRTVDLGNSFNLYSSGLLSGVGYEYLYLIENKIYVLVEEDEAKFEVYDLYNDEYKEIIDLSHLKNEIAPLFLSLRMSGNFDYTHLVYEEINEENFASEILVGNLFDETEPLSITISGDEYFTNNSTIYNDYLFIMTWNIDLEFTGLNVYDLNNQGALVGSFDINNISYSPDFGFNYKIVNEYFLYDFGNQFLAFDMNDVNNDLIIYNTSISAFGDEAFYYASNSSTIVKSQSNDDISVDEYIPQYLGELAYITNIDVNDKCLLVFVLLQNDDGLHTENIVTIFDKDSLEFVTYVSEENFESEIEVDLLTFENLIFFDDILVFAHEVDDGYAYYDKFYIYEIED